MMTVSIRPDLKKFVEGKVKAGEYADASEAINGALELLRDQERLTAEDVEELRAEIAVGIEQLDRGEVVEFTAKDIQAQGRRILAARDAGKSTKKARR